MLINWMSRLCPALVAQIVAVDGKTFRASRHRGKRAIHPGAARSSGLGMALGEMRTAEKAMRSCAANATAGARG